MHTPEVLVASLQLICGHGGSPFGIELRGDLRPHLRFKAALASVPLQNCS